MCGRYVSPAEATLEREFTRTIPRRWPPWQGSYNLCPSQSAPVIFQDAAGPDCQLMRFGLIPFFAKGEPPKYSTINATVERLESGPCWRGPWKRAQRCLVLASGFYEWQVLPAGRGKQPYFIKPADQEVFAFAGLWDASTGADGTVMHSFAIITLPASPLMQQIHNAKQREPAILAGEDVNAWLHGSPQAARAVLKPYPDVLLSVWPVSRRVNSPANNDAGLLVPMAAAP